MALNPGSKTGSIIYNPQSTQYENENVKSLVGNLRTLISHGRASKCITVPPWHRPARLHVKINLGAFKIANVQGTSEATKQPDFLGGGGVRDFFLRIF